MTRRALTQPKWVVLLEMNNKKMNNKKCLNLKVFGSDNVQKLNIFKKNRIDEKFFWMKQNIETKPCGRKGKRNLRRIKKIAKQYFKLWIQLSLISVHAMKKQNSEMHRSWLYDWLNDGIIIYKWIEALNWINRWHLDGINKRSDKKWISVCLS